MFKGACRAEASIGKIGVGKWNRAGVEENLLCALGSCTTPCLKYSATVESLWSSKGHGTRLES